MFAKGEFKKIRSYMDSMEHQREMLIAHSRDVIRLSKQLIYALHRDDFKQGEALVKAITAAKNQLDKVYSTSADTDMGGVAYQEFAEALCYHGFLVKNKLPGAGTLKIPIENYLGGLSDLTGELTRKAVLDATKKNFKRVVIIKDLVDQIHGEFLQFNLRNNELRKKSDAIKWNLKKLEDILFEAGMRGYK